MKHIPRNNSSPSATLPSPRKQQPNYSNHWQLILAIAMCAFGCVLLTAGIATPPLGVIDSSVLIAFGEILTFVGALIGIDYKYKKS